ncbi:MAG: polyribonucleotide nucleotidyltransferase [bacterium]|nr:polyribonucleotide nucleotidyltransferase [bacterium]
MNKRQFSTEVSGKTLTAEFSDLADQANGSVMLKYGNTVVLTTAVMSKYAREGSDFFPLTVDYEEKFYAAGKILGSRFLRREGRPSDESILSGRVVDRTIRPLFDQWLRNEIQVVVSVLSIDEDDPDILAVNAASLALGVSDIPWNGPVSAVRIGKHKGKADFIVKPTYKFREDPDVELDMVACGKNGNINMIEVGAMITSETVIVDALKSASLEIEKIQAFQEKIIAEIGKQKISIERPAMDPSLVALFEEAILPKMLPAIFRGVPGKGDIEALKSEWLTQAQEKLESSDLPEARELFESKVDELVHREAIDNDRRPDGRGMDDLRPLYAEAGGISPILHGTGIFYRGGTHILSALTLGGPGDSQVIEGMEYQLKKRFMHHYNFPPYSTGETGRMGGTNRRMIGHGALAEKALAPIIPPQEAFPYTIRLVSESMASNGSTSMGSVCASTLALMDGGVPIRSPVAGIASGLMLSEAKSASGAAEYRYKVLTDIQGPEDHHGDMDFKVAGTREGVTAVQMDVKVGGIPIPILEEALEKARVARLKILDVMAGAIKEPRPQISPNAPKIIIIKIKVDQIGLIIGTGGKTINEIKDKTGAEIDIEDDGSVFITGKNGAADMARAIILEMTREYKRGEVLKGEVTKITEFGAFVKIGANAEGLVHVSEIAPFRIARVQDVLKEGETVNVIIKEIDERGRIRLSIKDIDPNFAKNKAQK